ncbi:hypothetical protein CSUI_011293, partial [Cystoisospora suis]
IDALKNLNFERLSFYESLCGVFGAPISWRWFLPVNIVSSATTPPSSSSSSSLTGVRFPPEHRRHRVGEHGRSYSPCASSSSLSPSRRQVSLLPLSGQSSLHPPTYRSSSLAVSQTKSMSPTQGNYSPHPLTTRIATVTIPSHLRQQEMRGN